MATGALHLDRAGEVLDQVEPWTFSKMLRRSKDFQELVNSDLFPTAEELRKHLFGCRAMPIGDSRERHCEM